MRTGAFPTATARRLPATFEASGDPDRHPGAGSLVAWCPWCETHHCHGAAGRGDELREEARGAHCDPSLGSPLAGRSYTLIVGSAETMAAALVQPGKTLHTALRTHQGRLRRALILAVLAGVVEKLRLDAQGAIAARISVKDLTICGAGDSWHLTHGGRSRLGKGLPSLLAELFAVTPGIAARRILEATTAIRLPADHALALEGIVDQADAERRSW